MDPDLTGNGFRSFVGRRGIVRNAVPEEIAGRSAIPNGSRHGVPPPGGRVRSTGGAAGAVSRNSTAHTSLGASQAPVVGAATGTAPAQDSSRRQYFCEICNLPFGRKHHKERHVANIHRQVSRVRLPCDACRILLLTLETSAGAAVRLLDLWIRFPPEAQPRPPSRHCAPRDATVQVPSLRQALQSETRVIDPRADGT